MCKDECNRPTITDHLLRSCWAYFYEKEEEEKKKKQLDAKSKPKKAKGTLKQKKAQQNFLKNVSIFNQVNKHPEYVKNPLQTIPTHIENKMILESMQQKS